MDGAYLVGDLVAERGDRGDGAELGARVERRSHGQSVSNVVGKVAKEVQVGTELEGRVGLFGLGFGRVVGNHLGLLAVRLTLAEVSLRLVDCCRVSVAVAVAMAVARVGVGVASTAGLCAEDAHCLVEDEEGSKAEEDGPAGCQRADSE